MLTKGTGQVGIEVPRDRMKRDVKTIYTAVNADAARAALDELTEKWGKQYGAVIRLWENAP